MVGYIVLVVFGVIDLIILLFLYFEFDGLFFNYEVNLLDLVNLVDLQVYVCDIGVDIGFVFDGDVDCCFVVDECGQLVLLLMVIVLVVVWEFNWEIGVIIIYNVIIFCVVFELVVECGGMLLCLWVGYFYIKVLMVEIGVIFGGEYLVYYYFCDFWGVDFGMLVVLYVLVVFGEQSRLLLELIVDY